MCQPPPELAITADQEQTIAGLHWVEGNPQTAAALRDLATGAPAAFQAYLQHFGDGRLHQTLLDFYPAMARCSEEAAIRILQMPFLSGEYLELPALITVLGLARLAETDLDGLQRVLSHPELSDGITSANAALAALLVLAEERPAAAAAIQALPWVSDGITYMAVGDVASIHRDLSQHEHELVIDLVQMAHHSAESLLALVDKPWVEDGITTSIEQTAVISLSAISGRDEHAIALITKMPFLDSMTETELATLQVLQELQSASPDGLQQLLSSPALSGGITKGHGGTVALLDLEMRNPEAASAIKALSWVADGIDMAEQRAILAVRGIALESAGLFQALLAKPWVQDNLTLDEVQAIARLEAIGGQSYRYSDEPAALRIAGMPFMTEIDSLDVAALESLRRLVWVWEADKAYLQQVLSLPAVRNGITDEQTNVVAVLAMVAEQRAELLPTLFDPEQTIVSERTLTLPLAGDISMSVIWPGSGGSDALASQAMDLLEHAVRTNEGFMSVLYPKAHVILLIADVTEHGGGGGPSSILTVDPQHHDAGWIIAHEVAHTYWASPPTWIAEGAASFMDKVSENARTGAPLPQPSESCSLANNLSELVSLPREMREEVYLSACNYILGEGLFLDLYNNLGDEVFRQAFGNLYTSIRDNTLAGKCTSPGRGVCYVKAAFVEGLPPDKAAIAEEIINRRYYGTSQ